jgi:signal transduction histidine kinase
MEAMRMDTRVIPHPERRGASASLLLGERFQKSQCLRQQGAVQAWRGRDLATGGEVVLKTVPLHALQPGAVERMLRDDAVLRDLRSPWLSPPLDCGLEGDSLFRVAPLAPEGTLRERLARGPLSLNETLQLGCGLLRALREAHAQRVLHRHLKPSNVVIPPEHTFQDATLIDFGLALEDLQEQSLVALPLTALQYLSPEQLGLVAGDVGPASDLYAVGVMLFECLAGAPPFRAETRGEFLRQHLCVIPELRAQGLPVPRTLEQVVQHLLSADPQERYQSAAAVLFDLEAIASQWEQGISEPSIVVGRADRHPRLTEPAFIGRSAELEGLESAMRETTQGRGGLVLVEGESGTGKTMLLDELERRSLARGARVFRGQAIDRAVTQPLQTLLGVFRGVEAALEKTPAMAQTLREGAGTELSEVCSLFRLAERVGVPASSCKGVKNLSEGLMLRALATVLGALGDAQTPALVLLDDCQWSDELTLKVLAAFARPPEDAPGAARFVTVVAAFRTDEVREDHFLRRMAPMRQISLAPFTASDLRGLVESMAGRLPDEALDVVVRLSEGNPFMAAALVRGLVECGALESTASGWRVEPERLAEVRSSRRAASLLLRRLAFFSAETRALLAAAAILGREFEVDLAAVLVRQPREQAVAALQEARQRHLLWADASQGGRYTFAHDRIREALLEQLPAEEGRALHLAAALELEKRAPERSFELAWHFEAAGKLERACPYALRSAEAARHQHTLDLAERYYRLANQGAANADDATRMLILEGLGDVLRIRGKNEEADQSYAQAQALAATRMDRARLEGRRGEAAYDLFDLSTARARMEQSLRILGQRVPAGPLSRIVALLWEVPMHLLGTPLLKRLNRHSPPLAGEPLVRARLLIWLAQCYWHQERSIAASLWANLRSLNISERYAPTDELAAALTNHGAAFLLLPLSIRRLPTWLSALALAWGKKNFQRAMSLRKAFGDAFESASTLCLYQASLYHCAQYQESIEIGQRALRLFRQAGAGNEGRARHARFFKGLSHYLAGDLTSALAEGQSIYRQSLKLGDRLQCSVGLGLWACASGGRVPAEAIAIERARPASEVGEVFNPSQAGLLDAEGLRLLRTGKPEQAAEAFAQGIQHAKASKLRLPVLLSWLQARLVTALREQAVQLSSCALSPRAEKLRQAKAAAREVLRHPLPFRETLAPVYRELGLIAAMEGKNARARRYLDRSLAIAERLGMRYERALTLQSRAELGAALGWPTAGQDAAAAEEALRPMRPALEPAPVAEPQVSLSLMDRFPRILEAGRTIASALTRESVLSSVREAALGLLRGEECVLVEATPEGLPPPTQPGERIWPFLQRAQELKRPVVPSTEQLESAGGGPERSVLCVPLLVRGQVAAVFCVTNPKLPGAFGPEETRIAEFIATLGGAALENAQGFAEVNALSEERGRLYREAQEALRKRDEFLAVASHELRTPFTPMRIYLQGLISALRDPARAAGLGSWVTKLETANARLQRLAKLVEELFCVSRFAEGKLPLHLGEVDLAWLTAEAVDRWKGELARVQCECILEAPEPVIGRWDGLRLEQVIDNLLGNATKYGPGKPILVTVKREGSVARLTVRDWGMGIAPEDQARIFERFERAVSENYGGFGLGLWISREVVQAHGGRISVESAPGQGATFTVELPLE